MLDESVFVLVVVLVVVAVVDETVAAALWICLADRKPGDGTENKDGGVVVKASD